MKKQKSIFGLLMIALVSTQFNMAAYAQGEGAEHNEAAPSGWSTELERSLDRAEKEHKLVLADFYTSWCGWCKKLDQTTFADPALMKYMDEHYIPVKLNAEDKGEGQRAAEKNDVSAFPTGLVFNAKGKVVGRIFGYFEAPAYKAKLVKFAKKNKV
ncbi:MAG TPA: thioredoxin fold domain-containing protein [Drouetiella sp.]